MKKIDFKKMFSFKGINLPKIGFWLGSLLLVLFVAVILTMALRGLPGNPSELQLNDLSWKDNGPFELSPERGRFALTYSVVEDKSVHFSLPIARFATPDLGYKSGNYVSLFAPAVSFILIPGYLIGKIFSLSQLGTYAVIALFALFNVLLIRAISMRLGASAIAGTIGGLTFVFATPAFAYAVSLFQHHISVFLILLSVYILIRFKNVFWLGVVWFLAALSLSVDYPNFFMMFPIGLFGILRLFPVSQNLTHFKVGIKFWGFLTFIGVVLPMIFFLWFNQVSYGNPFQLAGTVASVQDIDKDGKPAVPKNASANDLQKFQNPDLQDKSAVGFFATRNMLSGLSIQFLSQDRGIIYYTPVILFGILGFIAAAKRKVKYIDLLGAIIIANVVLYSMWGDYWGGWAFGTRYLIPSYSILSIFIALLITFWKKSNLFMLAFAIVFAYSVCINTLGAITSSANPPQVEVLALEKLSGVQQKYTYGRNWDYLLKTGSKSFIYQTFGKNYLKAVDYYLLLSLLIVGPVLGLLLLQRLSK